MKQIKELICGRLADVSDINSEIITDLSERRGDGFVIKMIFEDDTQMLQVYLNMPYCDFNKEIKTFHKFFVRFSESDLWNSLDENLIDKTVYPNGNVMITSNHEFVNTGTETEPNLVSKYDYFKYSALGRGIENELKRDGIQRLVDAGIYIKPI